MPILWQQLIICCAYNQLPFEAQKLLMELADTIVLINSSSNNLGDRTERYLNWKTRQVIPKAPKIVWKQHR